ncbi:MAG: DsbA family protein [Pseudomonadota bacterium]
MKTIEYFYVAHSAFAFVGSAKLTEVAKANGRRIEHYPIDLHRVMAARGVSAFGERDHPHIQYFFRREIWRWAEYRGIEISDKRPTHHSNDYGLANRVLIASVIKGADTDALAHAFLVSHWRDDADLADTETLAALAADSGYDAGALLSAAEGAEVAERYEANTQEAIKRKIYGSPTYFVDGDMFYGQDHLELVERACRKPFGPSPNDPFPPR